MSNILHIFDASAYIYAGAYYQRLMTRGVYNSGTGPFESKTLNVSGISNLLNVLVEYSPDKYDLAFCFDRPPTFKNSLYKEIYPTESYKGYRRRTGDADIPTQKKLSEEILTMMGLNVFSRDDYEADDLVATLATNYKSSYDHIYVHANDADMYYLVDKNVSIMNPKSKKIISLENYRDEVDNEYELDYNTVMLWKIIRGDKSDNIPALPNDIARDILRIPVENYPDLGYLPRLKELIAKYSGGNELALKQFELIAPVIFPNDEVFISEVNFKRNILSYYGEEFGNKYFKNRGGVCVDSELEAVIDRYVNAKYEAKEV